jgi:excisionase family DNA binding protein
MIASDALRTIAEVLEQPTALSDSDVDRIAARLEARLAESLPVFDEWLTPEQACEVLQVSDTTLFRWERDGLLVPSRVGTKIVRFSRRDIAAVMATHKAVAS